MAVTTGHTLTSPVTLPTSPVPQTLWSGDEVIQFRVWASERVYPIPLDTRKKLLIGTAPECAIPVDDPSARASREHAYLERDGAHWRIVDQSKNGLFLDAVRHGKGFLLPGMRVGIGPRVTLVAESERTIALRAALARMMGWGADRKGALDLAFQNLRLAAVDKVFALCGEGDLLGFVEELHELAMGKQCPLVLCRPGTHQRRSSSDGEDRGVQRAASGREALDLAHGGTICLDNRHLPGDLVPMLDVLRDPVSPTQTLVIVLSNYVRKTDLLTPTPFIIPPLATRKHEIDRLIVECEAVAARRLGVQRLELTREQRRWIREESETLAELQTSILRLGALRSAGSLGEAAKLLRMSITGLRHWLTNVPTTAAR